MDAIAAAIIIVGVFGFLIWGHVKINRQDHEFFKIMFNSDAAKEAAKHGRTFEVNITRDKDKKHET